MEGASTDPHSYSALNPCPLSTAGQVPWVVCREGPSQDDAHRGGAAHHGTRGAVLHLPGPTPERRHCHRCGPAPRRIVAALARRLNGGHHSGRRSGRGEWIQDSGEWATVAAAAAATPGPTRPASAGAIPGAVFRSVGRAAGTCATHSSLQSAEQGRGSSVAGVGCLMKKHLLKESINLNL